MKTVIIQKSHRQDKKFDAFVNGEKIVSFGLKGAEDYTIHKDEERKTDTLSGMKRGRIGGMPTQRGSILGGCYGINLP